MNVASCSRAVSGLTTRPSNPGSNSFRWTSASNSFSASCTVRTNECNLCGNGSLDALSNQGVALRGTFIVGPDGALYVTDTGRNRVEAGREVPYERLVYRVAFDQVLQYSKTHNVNMRTAAYMVSIDRVAAVHRLRGLLEIEGREADEPERSGVRGSTRAPHRRPPPCRAA